MIFDMCLGYILHRVEIIFPHISLSTHFFHLCVRCPLLVAWNSLLKCQSSLLFLHLSLSSSTKGRSQSASFRVQCKLGFPRLGLYGGWGRTDLRSRLLWVKSWPASSATLKESCLWNSWIEVPQSVLERYLQILQKLRQRIWRFWPNRKVNQVLILCTVLI